MFNRILYWLVLAASIFIRMIYYPVVAVVIAVGVVCTLPLLVLAVPWCGVFEVLEGLMKRKLFLTLLPIYAYLPLLIALGLGMYKALRFVHDEWTHYKVRLQRKCEAV
ncbi:MAG: hypothetical protein ABH820_02400 [Patescibacteria group bacterium]